MTTSREVRLANAVLRVAVVLAVAGLAFAVSLRLRPPDPGEPVELTTAQAVTDPALGNLHVATAATSVAETLAAPQETLAGPQESASGPLPAMPGVVTEVILLPCSEPNPRPDGRFLIPPHDPERRTIVALQPKPGEPHRGLVIPPHSPNIENRIPIQLVPLDSILEHTIRIPPHDPDRYKFVRRDTLPCLDS